MSPKKIFLIIGGVVAAVLLLIALFVGGVIAFTLYSFGNSDAATAAKDFLRKNDQLKKEIGEVKDFGSLVSGSVNIANGNGTASFGLKVIGEKKTVNATVELQYTSGQPWRVTSASYKNDDGQSVDLLNPYDSFLLLIPQVA
jgi:archaellum component FlaF (FlaF/FlaG flagellin family)